ncbi:hypothetical protein AURDEDRAFT_184064 [Auricularia subglabra TFB-10046 SS5]|nr:hypothetical protein AURDEDRAFT_184064 [Auricularia subglabra TFB-10046 SS5]
MPVSRYWRQAVVDHPHYWSFLQLQDGSADSVNKSTSLFILRLSRTGSKPIDVHVQHADPGAAVFAAIAQHLAQITFLFLRVTPGAASQAADAFRAYPAPCLVNFYFMVWPVQIEAAPPPLPHDMFASTAPRLRRVNLTGLTLLPHPHFPAFLREVPALGYTVISRVPADLPDVFRECLQLKQLSLQGTVVLTDAAFTRASNWERLDEVDFNLVGLTAEQFPIRGVRCVRSHYSSVRTDTVLDAARSLTSPLSVAFHRNDAGFHRNNRDAGLRAAHAVVKVTLRSTVNQLSHERILRVEVPALAPGQFPDDAITAFQRAPLVETIVRLMLCISDWDDLIGRGYLTEFLALEDLVISVMYRPPELGWRSPDPKATLSCPRLQRLIIRRQRWVQRPVVDVAAVASFALAALPDTRFPLMLELNDVALEGAWKDFPQAFSGCRERQLTDDDDRR